MVLSFGCESVDGVDIIDKKNGLRDLVSGTSRGLETDVGMRGAIEEAQVR